MIAMQAWITRLPAITELALVMLIVWVVAGWLLPSEDKISEQNQVVVKKSVASLDMKLLLNTPLFGYVKKTVSAPVSQAKSIAPSRLKIKLLGTIVADDRSAAVVIMQRGREQRLFFVGDVMKPGVALQGVETDAIIVDNQGKLERILLQEGKNRITFPAPSKKAAPTLKQRRNASRKVSRNILDRR